MTSLADLRALVRTEYSRNSVSLDADTASVDAALNSAQREMALILGDHAWYLQRVEDVTWTEGLGEIKTLDTTIRRVLWLESAVRPGQELRWRGAGYDSDGSARVILDEVTSSPVKAHYLVDPTDLVAVDDDTGVPVPYLDALVLLACKRLGVGGGSSAMFQAWTMQAQERMALVHRDCMRYQRQREDTMRVVLDSSNYNDGQPEQGPWW